ncbi:MAG: hypothetical protein WC162_00870 [Sphaerochaetaceae bacterium]
MPNRKKLIIVLALLLAFIVSVFSSDQVRLFFSPSIDISGGSIFTFGLSEQRIEELIIPRTSFGTRIELGLLAFQLNKHEFQMGLVGQYISKSLLYGSYIPKAFNSLGFTVNYIWHPNYQFGLAFGYSLLFLSFEESEYKGAAHEFFVIPELTFTNNIENNFSVIFPIQITYRKDLLSLGLSIGFKWTKLTIMKAPIWLIKQQIAQGLR